MTSCLVNALSDVRGAFSVRRDSMYCCSRVESHLLDRGDFG